MSNTDNRTPINCFVAMFDIVGFKALRATKGTTELYKLYHRGILPGIEHSVAGKGKIEIIEGESVYVPDFSETTLRYQIMSDSIIIFTQDDSFESFFSIFNSSFKLLQFGFSGSKAPYRGAIGWGDLIADPSKILIGSALEDAFAGESSQAWAGAMLTANCRDFIDRNNYVEKYHAIHEQAAEVSTDTQIIENACKNSQRLVQYSVPIQINLKTEPVSYNTLDTYVIDWTIGMYEGASLKSFHISTNSHSKTIADNTHAFEAWARSRSK